MSVESLFPRLEPLLPLVTKPIQYVGGELNSTVRDWDSAEVRWALLYPDAYEVGLPNQGVMILYEVLNEQPGVLCERTYSVWPDLEALMRQHAIPQFTVDAHRPVAAFDVLGVSLSTELGYTNLLTALDLAGIPLLAAERTHDHPLVIAGGHAAFNPEPLADFLDAAVLGDGEQAGHVHPAAPGEAGCTCPACTTWTTCPTGGFAAWSRGGPTCRGGWPSTRCPTSTSGPTPRRRWCRWPRPCTSG